ncbi:MAG TPA: TlpA disulfide reductase family protein [Bacteroidales bacterium]|nr:TlpA disulfide reductase family protein [Bacteroidales bacterium]HOR81858.1 TlpA disulfide reductase family protein [Bacteroidales bacterium]HPJ92081.1 TlpA disulfide reductase family protein [Bacteroidales bacterium]
MRKIKLFIMLCVPLIAFSQINIGTKAPEIQLEAIYNKVDNKIPTLESLKGEIVVLDFWAIWCSPCVAAFPENNELYNKYKEQGLHFIAITDDPKEKLENFLKKVKVDFWIGRDEDKQDFNNYQIIARPQIYIINRDGIIVYQGSTVSEDMIKEVIATNSVTIPQKGETPKVILNGIFGPGEDPLYNDIMIMLGKTPSPQLIDHFIIRPSLDTIWGGVGCKIIDGFVGITCYAGKLENIFQLLHNLSSPIWIKNNTELNATYDIVYWKKIESIEKALSEIGQRLLNGLSIKCDAIQSKENINILSLHKPNEAVKKSEQIEDGAYNAYTSISTFVSELENKSQQLYSVDESLQDMFIHNQGMEWEKLYNADVAEILDFLKAKGIILKQEIKTITLYHINNK